MTTRDWIASTQLSALADSANIVDSNAMPSAVAGLTSDTTLAGGGSLTKDSTLVAAQAVHGTSGVARLDLIQTTPSAQMSVLIKCTLPTTNPSTNSRIFELMDNAGASMLRVDHLAASGRLQVYNAANAGIFNTTPDISGQVYVAIGVEPKTSTTGEIRFNVYDSTYTLIAATTYTTSTGNAGLLANGAKTVRTGRINTITDTGEMFIHYVRVSDSQITPLSPIAAPPTIVIASNGPYWEHNAIPGSTPGGGGALSFTVAHASGPNNSAGIREPVDGWFFIPQDTAESTYTVTVSEGGNDDSEVVTVPAISTGTPSGGVRRRRWNGSALV